MSVAWTESVSEGVSPEDLILTCILFGQAFESLGDF